MAPSRPPRAIKIKVPRHNAQRIGEKLSAQVQNLAKSQSIKVETYQSSPDLALAIESASEWNSLLTTARAERGPQWDVGTQQFLVDKDSDLYYDPTPLVEAVRKQTDEEKAEEQQQLQQQQQHQLQLQHQQLQQQHSRHQTPHRGDREFHLSNVHQMNMHDTPSQHHRGPPQVNYPYPSAPTPNMNMRGPPQGPGPYPGGSPVGNVSFNPNAQPPFFNGNMSGHDGSPMRMSQISGMGMGAPDMPHGMHPGGGMGGMMGISGIPPGMGMPGGGGMSMGTSGGGINMAGVAGLGMGMPMGSGSAVMNMGMSGGGGGMGMNMGMGMPNMGINLSPDNRRRGPPFTRSMLDEV